MKGLIAPLLAMMMTGMVFCQQPQSNRLDSTSINDDRLLNRYLLVMGQEYVRGLKNQGYLQSPIDPQDQRTIDHIVFHSNDRNSEDPNLQPTDIFPIPSSGENGRIEFIFTDDIIRLMRKNGLRYKILPNEVGKYREVVVVYDPPEGQARPTISVQPRETSQNRTLSQSSNFDRNPDDLFVGPRMTQQDRDRDTGFDSRREQSFTPRIGSIDERQRNDAGDQAGFRRMSTEIDNDLQNDRVTRRVLEDENDRSFNRQLDDRRNIRSDISPKSESRDGFLDSERTRFQERIRQDEVAGRDRDNEIARRRHARLEAENDELREKLNDEKWIRDRRERELNETNRALIAAESEARRRGRDELGFPYGTSYGRYPIDYPSNRYPNRYEDDYGDRLVADRSGRDSYTSMPNRATVSPRPSGRPPELAISGPEDIKDKKRSNNNGRVLTSVDKDLLAEADRIKRNQQALWFIMLCSVGLNFYLALIARSFYVRYEELADELRETFTSSTM